MSVEEQNKTIQSWANIVDNSKEPQYKIEIEEQVENIEDAEIIYSPDMEFDDLFGYKIFDNMYDIYRGLYDEFKFYDISFSKIYELFRNNVDITSVLSKNRDENDLENDKGDYEYDSSSHYNSE